MAAGPQTEYIHTIVTKVKEDTPDRSLFLQALKEVIDTLIQESILLIQQAVLHIHRKDRLQTLSPQLIPVLFDYHEDASSRVLEQIICRLTILLPEIYIPRIQVCTLITKASYMPNTLDGSALQQGNSTAIVYTSFPEFAVRYQFEHRCYVTATRPRVSRAFERS